MGRTSMLAAALAVAMANPLIGLAEPHPERLPLVMEKLAKIQAALQTKQELLITYAGRTGGSVRSKPFVEERLRDLVTTQLDETRLYQEFREDLQAVGQAAPADKVAAIEDEQKKLGANHMQLSTLYGRFWETPVLPGVKAAAAPGPGFGAQPVGTANPRAERDPASHGPSAPVAVTPDPADASRPPDGDDAAYKKAIADIQAVLGSETATAEQKAAAYTKFLQLKKSRNERFK